MCDQPGNRFSKLIERHHIKAKFLVVGAWNTLFAYALFCLLDTFFAAIIPKRHIAYLLAMFVGQVLGVINAFFFHKHLTFGSDVRGTKIILELIRFSLAYIVTFALNMASLPFFVEIVHIPPKIAAALLIPLCAVVSYLGHSRFTFRRGRHKVTKASGICPQLAHSPMTLRNPLVNTPEQSPKAKTD
jgi:putative flippase GtrA